MRSHTLLPLSFLSLASIGQAAIVSYDWTLTYVTASPDNTTKTVIGINNAWPCPKIEANVGDTIVVRLTNMLGDQTTGIHFHGINQAGTILSDGPVGTTQCPIPSGSTLTYSFLADAPGTYWYHSHDAAQYLDGFRGPLIIHDPVDPYKSQRNEEVILTVSDWYHTDANTLGAQMLQASNTGHRPPSADSVIVNEGGPTDIQCSAGKTLRLRILNFSAFGAAMITLDPLTMQVIMLDASYTQPTQAEQLRISAAQRTDILIACGDQPVNHPILVAFDFNRDYTSTTQTNTWAFNHTLYLVNDAQGARGPAPVVDTWRPLDDHSVIPYDAQALLGEPTKIITMDVSMCFDQNGIPRACLNNQTFVQQLVPAVFTVASTGEANDNPLIYGDINPFVVHKDDIVEIVLNNLDEVIHPFHLHGHQFQVVERPASDSGRFPGSLTDLASKSPARRDVVEVHANSHLVIRYHANNPGVFLFHCHNEWHLLMGLSSTIIEAPDVLRNMPIPQDHEHICAIQDIPTRGNAAGHIDVTDYSGFKTVPDPVFTGSRYVLSNTTGSADTSATSGSSASSRIVRRSQPQSWSA